MRLSRTNSGLLVPKKWCKLLDDSGHLRAEERHGSLLQWTGFDPMKSDDNNEDSGPLYAEEATPLDDSGHDDQHCMPNGSFRSLRPMPAKPMICIWIKNGKDATPERNTRQMPMTGVSTRRLRLHWLHAEGFKESIGSKADFDEEATQIKGSQHQYSSQLIANENTTIKHRYDAVRIHERCRRTTRPMKGAPNCRSAHNILYEGSPPMKGYMPLIGVSNWYELERANCCAYATWHCDWFWYCYWNELNWYCFLYELIEQPQW